MFIVYSSKYKKYKDNIMECKLSLSNHPNKNKSLMKDKLMKTIINKPLQETFNMYDDDSKSLDTFEFYMVPKEWKDHQRLLEYYNDRFEGYYTDYLTGITYLKVRPVTKTHRLF